MDMSGKDVALRAADGGAFSAYLASPASASGAGVVALQEIFGVNEVMRNLADGLAGQGCFAIVPDLFWRQEPNIQITDKTDAEWTRAFDLYQGFDEALGIDDAIGALEYLRGLPYVDPDQIAIIGWSHGGSSTLASVDRSRVRTLGLGDSQFRAAIAFYPGCDWHGFAGDFYAPVLVLIGEKDDWASAEACAAIKAQSPFGAEPIELKIYPGAYHGFDGSNPGSSYLGHWLQGDAKAARDARERVQAFLAKYLQ